LSSWINVWTTGSTDKERALALKLGVHRTFPSGEILPEVRIVFDMSGERTFKHSMESLAAGGTLVSYDLHAEGMFIELGLMKVFT
jgi:NADPH:quinone reductase-like Zn-dependent oxidoreductase